MCTIFSPQKRLETEHLIPAPQVSHTGSRKASASPGFLHACLARHCSAPWSLCAQALCRIESFCRPSSQRSSLFSPRHLPPFLCGRSRSQPIAPISAAPALSLFGWEPLPCVIIVPSPRTAAPDHSLCSGQEPLAAALLYRSRSVIGAFFPTARRLPLCAVPAKQLFRAPSSARRLLPCAACCRSRPSACRRRE